MKKVIRLTESDLSRIVRRVIKENEEGSNKWWYEEESEISDAYNEGFKAGENIIMRNKPYTENPYEEGTQDYDDFEQGKYDALEYRQ